MKGRDLKPHIGIFGRRNVGKSSFINAITRMDAAIVSDVAGTTTDPVRKSMEIFGIGPAILIDTAGIDDSGDLGEKRMAKTLDVLKQVDCAILIISDNSFGEFEKRLIQTLAKWDIPYFIVHNKTDDVSLLKETIKLIQQSTQVPVVEFSAMTSENM